jgi:predicted Zn-dependent protease with MMP-like domain
MLSMIEVSAADFEKMVAEAMDAIPLHYRRHMNNVAFVTEDEPSPEQREKLHLVNGVTLYGLYEGVPLTQRGNNYSGVLPDKITIFRLPILATSSTREAAVEQVKKTVWHEVAHHFGLGHSRIHKLERP